jgi:hypothetical protein
MSYKSYKETATERRDDRSAKDEIKEKPLHKKKNTKKFCKGKIGKEHELEVRNYSDLNKRSFPVNKDWKILMCKNCGEELDVYFPIFEDEIPPDWAK